MAENIDPQLVSLLAGGGIGSDARMPVAPVQRDPKMEKLIQVMAMSGRQPTPEMDAYLRAIAPEKEERGERLSSLARELSGVPQMGRAGSAIGEAAQDPSMANIANAGTQTALAAFRPALAMKALGAGYAGAAASDLGMFDTQAEAQTAKKAPLPGLTPEQQSSYDAAQKKLTSGDFSGSADRRQTEELLRELRTLSNDSVRQKNAGAQAAESEATRARQAEYDRQVSAAEAARDKERARDRRFSDTEVGKLWDKTGGLAPVLAGTVTGAMSRSATGGGNMMHNYALPAGLGALAGVGAANVPLAYNSLFTEPDNPQKRAMEAYARELPPSHPRRAEFAELARTMAEANPVRTQAAAEFYDPAKLKERAIMGGAEGLLGGMLGSDGPRTLSRGANAISQRWQARPQSTGSPTSTTPGGSALETGSLSPMPSAAGATSAEVLPPMGGRPPLAERVRTQVLPEPRNDDLARILAQDQRPSPSTPSSSDLVRTLAAPANRNVPKSSEVRRGKDKLGRPYAKDPDDGKFTSDPDR